MPTFMPPKPTRNGPGTKEPLPTMQKEGTRNVQECFIFFPHGNERRSWVSSELELVLYSPETQERWRCGKMTIFAEMVQKRRLQQGFRQNLVVSSPPCEQSPSSGRRALRGACFWGSKTSMSGLVAVGPQCAQLKTYCRIGGRNHQSRYGAMIVCDTCTQRSAIVFLTPGHLAGQMHTPRIHFEEHMHTEKTPFQHQIWPQKRGQFPDLQFVPFPIEGWFWGPLIGLRNGASQLSFFSPFALSFGAQYLVSMAEAATILCLPDRLHHQNVYLLRVSLRNHNHMRSIQLLGLQAYTHCIIYIYIYFISQSQQD